ncbi:hypothetical protein [Pleionea sediminis]|uniref:hypothetical protein n=1 Tax=Pleionea sediminis TaxID=2569479 RepID=UPI001185EBBB|nr:hypothetical protein [Pleionea sediminis]
MNLKSFALKSCLLLPCFTFLASCSGGSNDNEPTQEDAYPVVNRGDFESLRATISTNGFPELFTTGEPNEEERASIRVYFDINEDGVISKDDLSLALSITVDAETRVESLTASLYKELTDNPYSGVARLANIEYEIIGNDLTFIVNKTDAEELNGIGTMTPINVTYTISNLEFDRHSFDYIPDSRTFTQVQNVSYVADALSDFSGSDSRVDIKAFRLELY